MSYSVRNFANTVIYTVADSSANTNALSLTLLGKSLANYGTYLNQNFVWLTENFSSDSANPPPYAVQGQLWWDNTYKFLNVYDGSNWKTVYGNLATLNVNGAVTVGTVSATNLGGLVTTNSQPYITTIGNLTANLGVGGNYHNWGSNVLSVVGAVPAITLGYSGVISAYIYSGPTKVVIGSRGITGGVPIEIQPAAGAGNGNPSFSFTSSGDLEAISGGEFKGYITGAIGANTANTGRFTTVTTTSGGQHIGYITGALGANTPNSVVATSVTTSSGGQHIGYITGALGANTPNSVVATSVTTSSGGQVTGYLTGAIGANSANTGAFTTITSTSHVTPISNNTSNIGALSTLYANVLATNFYVANSIIPIANVSADIGSAQRYYEGAYVVNHTVANSIIPTSNVSANIGSVNRWFSSIYGESFYGTSTAAQYADLAEKYLPDAEYDVGTVMMIGGTAEVTQHDGRKVRAIGVISEYPAYKMNDGQEGGVYVALKGRVPVKVIGPVEKGQSLIGTAHGLAVAQSDDSQWMFGIALENHPDKTIKLIEAVIL